MAIWTNDGILVVNASNEVVECDECPCETVCTSCAEVLTYATQFSQVEVVLDFKNGTAGGINCNSLDGTYILDYLADPTALEGGTDLFGVNDRVWAYELPAPVTILAGAGETKATHIFFNVSCSTLQSINLGFRDIRTSDSVVTFRSRWLASYGSGVFVCDGAGTLSSNGVTAFCEADGTATYEYIL